MPRTLVLLAGLLLLPLVAVAGKDFSWEGVYEYSEEGETVTGVKFDAGRTITVKKISDGTYVAEVEDFGRMTSEDVVVCDVRFSNNNQKITLLYKGIRRQGGNELEKNPASSCPSPVL